METLLLSVRFELLSFDMVEARESLLAKLQELQSNPPKGGASSWDAFVPETKLRLPQQEPSFAEHGADPFDKQAYMEGDEPQAEEQSLRAEHGLAVPQVRRHSAQRRLPTRRLAASASLPSGCGCPAASSSGLHSQALRQYVQYTLCVCVVVSGD